MTVELLFAHLDHSTFYNRYYLLPVLCCQNTYNVR